jgi:hypothetical protein
MAHVHDSRGCGEPWSLLAAFSFRASRPDPAHLSGVVSGLRPSPQENAKMNLAGARGSFNWLLVKIRGIAA